MTQPPAIAVTEATVELDGVVLLPPTTFTVAPGELWCVTGRNGSGKTTLLRALIGSQELTGGSCWLAGEPIDVSQPRQRRRLASLVEPIPVARDMTVREQITLVAASWHGNHPDTADEAADIIDRLGLTALGERFPHQVSSGQLQLFSLALTLVRPSQIVLLDEPERHLDRHRVDLVAALLRERTDEGAGVLIATHDDALVAACDGRVQLS